MQITNLAASTGPFTTYDLWPAKCSQSGPQHESNIPRNPAVEYYQIHDMALVYDGGASYKFKKKFL